MMLSKWDHELLKYLMEWFSQKGNLTFPMMGMSTEPQLQDLESSGPLQMKNCPPEFLKLPV